MKKVKNELLVAALGLALVFAAPVTAQDTDLISGLVSQLGISEAQATGGVQAILGTAKGKLSPTDYSSLLSGAPSLGKLAEGMGSEAAGAASGTMSAGEMAMPAGSTDVASQATEMAGSASEMPSMGDAAASAGDALGGLDMSSLSQLTGLTSQFSDLGLDAGMVQKFVPALLQQFGKDSATSSLLMKGLGLL